MKKKMAEVRIDLDCGGHFVTYLTCKGEKDLLKKLRKIHSRGEWSDFGHVRVRDENVVYADYVMHGVH